MSNNVLIEWFESAKIDSVGSVGGKGASLGEMHQKLTTAGVHVPNGFTVTVDAYHQFVNAKVPSATWDNVANPEGVEKLRASAIGSSTLSEALNICLEGANIEDHLNLHGRASLARALVRDTPVPESIRQAIIAAYSQLCEEYGQGVDVAVRSSATTEDSAEASFAGQYESFLNISGERAVIQKWRQCVASLFTERAIGYQLEKDMNPLESALAVVVMKMVRSDCACSGVMFTIDPDSGHNGVIHIASAYGLGELVVQGSITPDTYTVWKEGLRRGNFAVVHRVLGSKDRRMIYAEGTDNEVTTVPVSLTERKSWSLTHQECRQLSEMALAIEEHYGQPMDIEWAKDGITGQLFIVQARPETVHSRSNKATLIRYQMDVNLTKSLKQKGLILATGQAVGKRIGSGKVRSYNSYEEVLEGKRRIRKQIADGLRFEEIPSEKRVFEQGDVLVTGMTTPDWEPLMKQASLIITRKGGRTSHAAIIAREFGIPAIVGCAGAMQLENLTEVTGSCAEGDTGVIYSGIHPFEIEEIEIDTDMELQTKIKLNVGFPTKSLVDSQLPVDGVGLARIEFVLSSEVGIHPLAFIHHEALKQYLESGEISSALATYSSALAENEKIIRLAVEAVETRAWSYEDKRGLFIDKLREGVGLICAAFHPRPVLVRLSDFKSNEYRELIGGRLFEPKEENPMIAWRGASRYLDVKFKPAFEMELEAMASVRHDFGLDNLQLMVPFCRSPEEGEAVKNLLDEYNVGPASDVPLFVMVELPSNIIDADNFITKMELHGGSIGSNDLVQTVYAVSRDDLEGYQYPVDARSPAVKAMIREAVSKFKQAGLEIGICGQAPSDYPEEFPSFLIECGITSISVTPDTVMAVRLSIAAAEQSLGNNS
ncbi:MAG TPA: phosphoenolpyruvate synthase [Candidatus Poseidoniales archaeon]|nr:MAG: phosphoenolpyruvate synthase [Euryarchaeota archaeon]HIG03383.1 phosphoenolpyruvate synthase [Candidatus Poseidoniales archaeon]